MLGPDGQQVQTISLKDPEQIRLSVADPNADMMRECIVPLLLDVRNLLVANMNMLNGLQQMGNMVINLLAEQRESNANNKIARIIGMK